MGRILSVIGAGALALVGLGAAGGGVMYFEAEQHERRGARLWRF